MIAMAALWTGLLMATASPGCGALETTLAEVQWLRLRGALDEARVLAERGVACEGADAATRIRLHLQLARIHDRYGLHRNERPVRQVLEHAERGEALATGAAAGLQGEIEIVKAIHHYRAETSEREFATATRHARDALRLFEQAGDGHGTADAVHLLGLVHLQRRELEAARELFDRSRRLDDEAGSRAYFRGDYERHVGFLYVLAGDAAASIPYFERSLHYRKQAEAIDATLFAARALASALINAGRAAEAQAPLLQAMMLAEKLASPVGKARVGLALGQMYEQLEDTWAATQAYEMTRRVAAAVTYASVERRAAAALKRLAGADPEEPDDP